PGGAEPALESVVFPERGLERVERPLAIGEPLDGRHARAVGLDGKHRARLDRASVELDRAGSALARVAPDVCPGEVQVLAEDLNEEASRIAFHLTTLAVHAERHVRG